MNDNDPASDLVAIAHHEAVDPRAGPRMLASLLLIYAVVAVVVAAWWLR